MESQSLEGGKACLVIIYGIPASGKTLLTTKTLKYIREKEGKQSLHWNLFSIHFDDFYPPDMRSKIQEDKDTSADHFHLKKARQVVKSHLEAVLTQNFPGEETTGVHVNSTPRTVSANLKDEFHRFLHYLNRDYDPPILDDTGRLRKGLDSPSVFILDDTMPLRSMRREYYQVARNCKIGFVEVCLRCPLPTALLRNSTRSIPIPESTILGMERRLEIPEPSRYCWEKRSIVVTSECGEKSIASACENITLLIKDALANPVPPIAQVDPAVKESSRLANLNSYIHQADLITRKCVSEILKDPSQVLDNKAILDKAILAKKANAIRMKILGEVRRGSVTSCSGQIVWELDGFTRTPEQFKKILLETFHDLVKQEI